MGTFYCDPPSGGSAECLVIYEEDLEFRDVRTFVNATLCILPISLVEHHDSTLSRWAKLGNWIIFADSHQIEQPSFGRGSQTYWIHGAFGNGTPRLPTFL